MILHNPVFNFDMVKTNEYVVILVNRATGRLNTSWTRDDVVKCLQADNVSNLIKADATLYVGNDTIKDRYKTLDGIIVCELNLKDKVNDTDSCVYDYVSDSQFYISKSVSSETNPIVQWVVLPRSKGENNRKNHAERAYMSLIQELTGLHMKDNALRENRTDIQTVSVFGRSIRLDISNCKVPCLTSKRVSFKNVVEELLWFCRGETDTTVLANKGIRIWDGNSSREFLDNRGLFEYEAGDIGPGYGFQWRHAGSQYRGPIPKVQYNNTDGVDQLEEVVKLLKTDPFSRRIVLSAWAPNDLSKMALPPCHVMAQWYASRDGSGNMGISCMLTMRSCDTFLGLPWNMLSYAMLTHILAKKCNMHTRELIVSIGDCHLYQNCIDQALEQITRQVLPQPMVKIDDSVANKTWDQITVNDFQLTGYYPYPIIKAEMAV